MLEGAPDVKGLTPGVCATASSAGIMEDQTQEPLTSNYAP